MSFEGMKTFYFKELTVLEDEPKWACVKVDMSCFDNATEACEHASRQIEAENELNAPVPVPKRVIKQKVEE